MNEFMINMGFITYGCMLLVDYINYKQIRNENIYTSLPVELLDIIIIKINLVLKTPQTTLGELPKDYRLNMKRRPPIILGAH